MIQFKASNGKYYTRQLFWEEWINLMQSERVGEPPFSLFSDKPGMLNFGAKYVELEDPTGYKISQELLDGYRMWQVLMKCKWFQAAKKVWDEELDAKLASSAISQIKELAESGPPAQQLAAAKYLANKEHRKDSSHGKGRPSKAQVEAEAQKEAALDRVYQDDLERIRLVR
jgi:hypothetical protein